MRQKLLLLLLLLVAWGAQAQAPAWQSALNSAAVDVRAVAMNASGDVFVTGSYTGTVTFGPYALTSTGGKDVFVAKWASGASAWAWGASCGGSVGNSNNGSNDDMGNAIAVNGTRVYVSGQYLAATAVFGSSTLTNVGLNDMFVARFTDNGSTVTAVGAQGGGSAVSDIGYGVAVNPTTGNVYVAGYFGTPSALTATIGGSSLTSNGSADVFVAKYTDNGSGLVNAGATNVGGTSAEQATCIALNGNTIYVGGRFGSTGTAVFGTSTLTSAGANDIFIVRLTDTAPAANNGITVQNGLRGGGDQTDGAQGIAVNGSNVYVTGFITSSGVPITVAGSTLTNAGGSDIFVAKYTDSGSGLVNGYAVSDGSAGIEDGTDSSIGADIAVNGNAVYVTSDYNTSATIAGTALTNAGGTDVFVAKYTDTGVTFTGSGAVSGGGAGDDRGYGIAANGSLAAVGGTMTPTATFGTALTTGTSFAARVNFAAAPTVTTTAANSITTTSAVLGGNVTADGGVTVTDRGVVYSSTNTTPAIGGSGVTQAANGTGTGTFSATISPLTPGTTYYVRAYAINSSGTSYGAVQSFTTLTTVTSIVRAVADPTNAASVPFTVTFANPVTGLSISNFSLTIGGSFSTLPSISSVSGSGTTYTVTVNTGTGSGTLQLNLANSTGISPGVSNVPFTSGETYNIDKTAPSVAISSTVGASGSTTSTSPIPFTVTFSEAVTGFVAGDVTVTNGTIGTVSGSGTTYTFNVTPTTAGTATTVNVPAAVAQDAAGNFNTAAPSAYSITYSQPVTAAPVVITPPNVGIVSTTTPTYAGTAVAASTVTVFVDGTVIGTTTATAGGNWSLSQPTALAQGSHTVRATAQSSGSAVSANSNTNTFTVDSVQPTVAISSSAGVSGSTTGTSPIPYTVTFSEAVTGFVTGDITVTNGVISGFSGSGTTYTFNVTPTTAGTVTTVNVPANVAQDAAGNGNTAATQFSLTYVAPTITLSPSTLPNGTVAAAYSQTLTASGGTAPYSYAITAGALPAGLTLSSAGVLTGTPTAGGLFTFTVRATDSSTPTAFSGSRSYTLTMGAPTIAVAPTTLPNGTVAAAYSQAITASGGTAPYSYAITAGALPAGLTLSSAGVLSGTPTASGSFTFTVTATDASTGSGPYSGSRSYSVTIGSQPVTAAPVVTAPANGSTVSTATPTYVGTAVANSTVAVYVDGTAISTTTATAAGNFSLGQPTALAQGSHTVYATAQTSGSAVSTNSNTNTFTVDSVQPTVAISSTAGANGSTTGTSPIPFTVTFSEAVTGFVTGDITVGNGTISGFSGSGTTYTFNVTPTTAGTATTVNVPANVAQDAAGNGNTAATQFNITYAVTAVAQTVTVQLNANGTATLNASSVNNGSTGAGTLTYAIQKVVYGQVGEGATLTLATPTSENFSAIRYASYGTSAGSNGNYTLGFCNATNSTTIVGNALLGNASGSITADNSTFGDPCGGTVKNLAVVAAYSANATSLPYTCANVAGPNYVLLTVTDGNGNTSTMTAQVTVLPPPTATITSVSPTSALVGTTVTISGTNLSGATAIAVNGTAATIASASASALTFQVPTGATSGNVVVSLPCGQSLSQAFTVVTPAPVVTAPANGSLINTRTPAYTGTAPANSSVTIVVDGTSIGTTTATAGGTFSLTQPTNLADGSHTVRATAQLSGSAVSANSNTNTFTVDATNPTVAISSTAGASGSTTGTTPVPFTITFSESVTGFVTGDVTVTNGVISGFSGSGTTYTFNVTPTTAGTVTTVNVPANVAQDAAGNGNTAAPSAYSITYVLPITLSTWTGTVSTDWFTAGNWTAGVPTSALDAVIPVVSSNNYPLIGAGTANAKNVTLSAGATFTQTGGTLAFAANLVNNGTFTATGGLVSLNGSSSQSIGGSSTTRFWNLTVGSASATLSGVAEVQRLLTLNGTLTTGGNSFTLLSSAISTALVVNNGGVVVGTTSVQRYLDPSLNAGLGYRHYSSPVQSTTVADLATSTFAPVVNPAYNTTGASVTPFPTVYGYDEARVNSTNAITQGFDRGYFSPGSTSDQLALGRGYTVNIDAASKVDLVGTLNTGTVPVGTLTRGTEANSGWHLLGNPYPAPLDWTVARTGLPTGVIDAVYIFKSSSQYAGTYQFYQNGFGTLPGGLIGSMQGFFVRVSQNVPAFNFLNTWRSTTYQNPTFNRSTADIRPSVQLELVSAQGARDAAFVYFEQGATAGLDDHYDAAKLPNTTGLNLASVVSVGQNLAVNGLPVMGSASVTVPLFIGLPATGTYSLHAAQLLNFGAGAQPFLRDLQLNTLTDLSLTPDYTFTMNAANNTPRFELVFGPAQVLGTASAALAAQVAVFPNPAHAAVSVELPGSLNRKAVTATLVDALGRVVVQKVLPAGLSMHTLPLTNVATGVYSLRLQTEAGMVVKKLVVE